MSNTPIVYLAGPMKGLTYEQAIGWRHEAEDALREYGIRVYSPMRAKEFLNRGTIRISNSRELDEPLETPIGMVTRDRHDVYNSNMVLFNTYGATAASIGTPIEIGWADAYRKPMVMVTDRKDDNPFVHSMVDALIGFQVYSIEDAAAICASVLLP